ncbi:hypothetical protein [Alkalicoccobacillus murimartini]|uniref:Uncharacterized protein n=1 Tax=Alkalicoccobacillus murimartini TaxID=171685 RepID=A0ABT9YJT1_9BACI|nr:hypothetical protein [Alkalicoccobacillus murimartini]MDQ0207284.1 hypothetical protein [Alkalicoccobacillus murimartini]
MISRLERELFQRELDFLKMLRGKMTEKETRFSDMVEDEINHIEMILKETEMQMNE